MTSELWRRASSFFCMPASVLAGMTMGEIPWLNSCPFLCAGMCAVPAGKCAGVTVWWFLKAGMYAGRWHGAGMNSGRWHDLWPRGSFYIFVCGHEMGRRVGRTADPNKNQDG